MENEQSESSFSLDVRDTRSLFVAEDGTYRVAKERRLLMFTGFLGLLVVGLVLGVVVLLMRPRVHDRILDNSCTTDECIRSANNLIRSMDTHVEPCDDFYQFACGRWAQDHPLPDGDDVQNWFIETKMGILRQMQAYLEANDSNSDPQSVKQARRLYRSCMNTERRNALGLAPLLAAAERLALGEPPGAPPRPGRGPGAASPGWRLERALAEAKRALGLDVLLTAHVSRATDPARSRITVGAPTAEAVLSSFAARIGAPCGMFCAGGDERPVDGAAGATRRPRRSVDGDVDGDVDVDGVATAMGQMLELTHAGWAHSDNATNSSLIVEALKSILTTEAEIVKTKRNSTLNDHSSVTADLMTVEELQKDLDEAANGTFRVNLTLYLQLLFEGEPDVVLRLGADAGHDRDLLQVYDRKYLRALAPLLASLSDRTLQDYVWWSVLSSLATYTTTEMRQLNERLLKALDSDFVPPPRSRQCAVAVDQLMGLAMARFFHDAADYGSTLAQVEQMFEDIRWAFDARVGQLDWMDDATKAAARAKAAGVQQLVGLSSVVGRAEALDAVYQGVAVEEDSFLETVCNMLEKIMSYSLRRLRNENEVQPWFLGSEIKVNAEYSKLNNAMVIEFGILQFPFFLLGLQALNYGALGSMVGHELTHGFDNEGRKYDKDGNKRQWWNEISIAEYEKRTRCFVEQYNQYGFEEISTKVDGKLTLGENIADNGGLREAFYAYQRLKNRRGQEEPTLPGLERYSGDQLFFLSFANVLCGKWTKKSLENDLRNEHPPDKVRVTGALVNSPEFAQTWGCPKGSRMNPHRERCTIW